MSVLVNYCINNEHHCIQCGYVCFIFLRVKLMKQQWVEGCDHHYNDYMFQAQLHALTVVINRATFKLVHMNLHIQNCIYIWWLNIWYCLIANHSQKRLNKDDKLMLDFMQMYLLMMNNQKLLQWVLNKSYRRSYINIKT